MTAPQETGPQETGPQETGPKETAHECARAWAALTAAHARVSAQLTTALRKSSGLTITDFEILLRLDAGTGLRIGDLTGAIRLSQPALSRAVARLAGRGWLTRSGSPADARCVLITLTPAGRDVLSAATAVHASVISETLLGKLSPAEQEQLARVLARVADG